MTRTHLKELNFFGWLACAAIFLIAFNVFEQKRPPVDFAYFYSVGKILNQYPAQRLYDGALQQQTFRAVQPLEEGIYGPSPYPPYVAVSFRPFALLSFRAAHRLWMAITFTLYLSGLLLAARIGWPGEAVRQSALCCFGLLSWAFISKTLLNGQLSAVGFFALALAIWLESRDQQYLSGLALSVCVYKPTLLLLIVPMLLVTRRWKTVGGFAAGAAGLTIATVLIEGFEMWPAYLEMSRRFAGMRSLLVCDYVDILSFSTEITRRTPGLKWAIGGLVLAAAVSVIRIWLLGRPSQARMPALLIWGTTITWTLVLNVYVPLYDTILVVVSIAITASAFRQFRRRAFFLISLCILLASYTASEIDGVFGVQIMTLCLGALGILQLLACFRTAKREPVPELEIPRDDLAYVPA